MKKLKTKARKTNSATRLHICALPGDQLRRVFPDHLLLQRQSSTRNNSKETEDDRCYLVPVLSCFRHDEPTSRTSRLVASIASISQMQQTGHRLLLSTSTRQDSIAVPKQWFKCTCYALFLLNSFPLRLHSHPAVVSLSGQNLFHAKANRLQPPGFPYSAFSTSARRSILLHLSCCLTSMIRERLTCSPKYDW